MDEALKKLREEIDSADEAIITALSKRMQAVKKVGKLKAAHNIPPLDQARWQKVLESKKSLAKSLNLSENLVHELYETIHKHALELEKK